MSFELDQSQLAAVKFASEGRFSIVNGGAGCGKTTIIKKNPPTSMAVTPALRIFCQPPAA